MPEEPSDKMFLKLSENLQELFDLSTRLDERVKLIQKKEEQIDERINELFHKNIELVEKIALLEPIQPTVSSQSSNITALERRISKLEDQHGAHSERWKNLANFFIQLIWVILAAYLLTQLNLQSPNVP